MDISSLRMERVGSNGAISVGELNGYIKSVFDKDARLNSVSVFGEISNFTHHKSGHLYFTLKDAEGQIRAVMFQSRAQTLKFRPESGMKVTVQGSVSVFQRDGTYQIYVNSMTPDGVGSLYLAYEEMKNRLFNEGLFDSAHKKQIPKYPSRIGVITSPTGAAVRDIINVIGRRFPAATIYLYPVRVQGEGASSELVSAIDYFDRSRLCEVVIIGRGGGSIEDLWEFNSELLARRIFSAEVPIISAVGHETDFTICDFVSDLRAPTPSAAAELCVPDLRELYQRLDVCLERVAAACARTISGARAQLSVLASTAKSSGIYSLLLRRRENLSFLTDKLSSLMTSNLEAKRSKYIATVDKLSALNPLSVLSRGYSVTEIDGKVVSSVSDISAGAKLRVRLADGSFDADVINVFGG